MICVCIYIREGRIMTPTSINSPVIWIKSTVFGTQQPSGGRSPQWLEKTNPLNLWGELNTRACLLKGTKNHNLTWTSFLEAVLACNCKVTGCRTLGEPMSYQGSPKLNYGALQTDLLFSSIPKLFHVIPLASSNCISPSHDGYLATSGGGKSRMVHSGL